MSAIASVYSLGKLLGYKFPAHTLLGSVSRVDFHEYPTSSFSLVGQHSDEFGDSNISICSVDVSDIAMKTFDRKVFYENLFILRHNLM